MIRKASEYKNAMTPVKTKNWADETMLSPLADKYFWSNVFGTVQVVVGDSTTLVKLKKKEELSRIMN